MRLSRVMSNFTTCSRFSSNITKLGHKIVTDVIRGPHVIHNNNNNIYELQLGCHPVAVVILHVHKLKKKVTRKFKSGGLHEKHVVATWKLGNHLSIRL